MFEQTKLNNVLTIDSIVTLHYFEYARDFVFSGEKHDFWEMVYIDSGEVGVMAENIGYTLGQGEIIFHKPNEYHNIWANGVFANVFIVTFYSDSPSMDFFKGKILKVDNFQKNLLSLILKEGKQIFAEPLNIPFQTKLVLNKDVPFGAEQLIKMYLEQFLISLIRSGAEVEKNKSDHAKEENEDRIVESIILYLEKNIDKLLSLDDVCADICFSKSYIKQLFSRKKGQGIIEYFNQMKIEEAKRLISENKYSFTEIADMLGFSSLHYFSRVFKNKTTMPPSAYAKSIQKEGIIL